MVDCIICNESGANIYSQIYGGNIHKSCSNPVNDFGAAGYVEKTTGHKGGNWKDCKLHDQCKENPSTLCTYSCKQAKDRPLYAQCPTARDFIEELSK